MFKKNLIIIIVFCLITGFLGYQLGLMKQVPQETEEVKEDVITFPKTKMISSWSATARGEIIEISNRILKLKFNDEILSILIKEDARIYQLVLLDEATGKTKQEKASFEDIKVGDGASIIIQLKEGKLNGEIVTIYP